MTTNDATRPALVPEPDAVLTAEQRTELIGELEEMLWMHASHIEADWYSIVWNAVLPVVEKWLALPTAPKEPSQ